MGRIGHTLVWIFCALVLGIAVGMAFPVFALKLSPISLWALQLIKAAAGPLVFLVVFEAIVCFSVQGRDFIKLVIITSINASFAVFIGLLLANWFKPGNSLTFLSTTQAGGLINQDVDFVQAVGKQLPKNMLEPFIHTNIMAIVLIALALGFAARKVLHQSSKTPSLKQIEKTIFLARSIMETLLIWLVKLIPVVVFASSARLGAEHGLEPLKGLGNYVAFCLVGMSIHLFCVYGAWIRFFVGISFWCFLHHALKPALYAFTVNSSLAALPVTLQTLDDLGVSRRASTLAACVGTNLNNDGIILYEGFTLIVLAQALGIDLSLSMQIFVALYCIIAAMGVAGVPEAGVVALTLVMTSVGISPESLAVLLSVDWILARARSLLNTTTDITSALILDRWFLFSYGMGYSRSSSEQ